MDNQDQKRGSNKLWLILLILSVGLNFYQWFNHTTMVNTYEQTVETKVIERVNVEKELSESKAELDKYRGISANLDSLLNEAQGKIDLQAKKIKEISYSAKDQKKQNEEIKKQ